MAILRQQPRGQATAVPLATAPVPSSRSDYIRKGCVLIGRAVSCCRNVLAIIALLETGIAWAHPVPTVSTKSLVEFADLIIVGRVERVHQTGTGEVTFHERTYTRLDFRAEITVDRTIKGNLVPSKFILSYSTPAMDRVGNVAEGGLFADTYRVVLLKKTSTGYVFASPYYASLPASPRSCGPRWGIDLGQDAYNEVLQTVLDVLCSSSGVEEKRQAVGFLNWGEDSSATPFLKAAMGLPDVKADPELRTSIISDLLKWKDLTVLSLAEDELFLPSRHTEGYLKSNLLLAASSLDPQISIPLLTRALKLPETEARVGAARFLEYTHSDTALDALLSALDDPDREVQFVVMQSLGNLTSQHQWRPKSTETDAAWFACVQHWHEFGQQRRPTLVPPSQTELLPRS